VSAQEGSPARATWTSPIACPVPCTAKVLAWLTTHETQLAINPIILGELRFGILLLTKCKRRSNLLQWLESVISYLTVLDFDAKTSEHWAQLLAELRKQGRAMPLQPGSAIRRYAEQPSVRFNVIERAEERQSGWLYDVLVLPGVKLARFVGLETDEIRTSVWADPEGMKRIGR